DFMEAARLRDKMLRLQKEKTGGTTENGLPYFVLEYVEGLTITHYCDEHKLNTLDRLKLFRDVCAAVQFAHQNLIVHRDLKPSNILVTKDGTPKLLDFGIAKLLSSDWSPEIEATETMARLLTPEYASPEQLRGLPMATTGDVYSLGVVLYELLSGHRPFNFDSRSPEEAARMVSAAEPMKASVVIGRNVAAPQTADQQNSLTPEAIGRTRDGNIDKLRRRLAGDLDNILLKALRRDPKRRYASVQEFSEDLRRHLEGLPVFARPDTLSYRTSKFLQRHTASVLAAAAIILTLCGATAVTTWQARVARRERDKAQRRFKDVRNLADSFLFDFHDSIADLNGATKAREMVVKKAQEYLDSLWQEVGDEPDLLWELSTAYLKLGDVQGQPGFSRTGDTAEALKSYERSLELRRRLVALDPNNAEYKLGLAVTLSRFGPMFQVLGRPTAAVERMREATKITDELLPQSHDFETYQSATRNPAFLGDALSELGNYDEALEMYQKCLTLAEQKRGAFPDIAVNHRIAVCRERLGFIFAIKGDYQKSLDNHLAMLTIEETLSAQAPTNVEYGRGEATALDHVGDAYRGLRDYPKALENGRRSLAMYENFLAKEPQNARAQKDVGDCSHHVSETLLDSGDYRRALSLLQRTLTIRRALVASDSTNVEYPDDLGDSLTLAGEGMKASGNLPRAIAAFQEARAIEEPIVSSHGQRIDYRRGLARLYTDLGDVFATLKKPGEAEIWYQRGLALWLELQNQHALWVKETNMPKEVNDRLSQVRSSVMSH
ncbi:MAG: serine/threonine-protein kinase, partial [Acidobacteriota bacterium]